MTDIKYETGPDGSELAYREDGGEDLGRTGFFWLGGFKSDMEGSKAETLASLARDTRRTSSASTIPARRVRRLFRRRHDFGLGGAGLPHVHPQGAGPPHRHRLLMGGWLAHAALASFS